MSSIFTRRWLAVAATMFLPLMLGGLPAGAQPLGSSPVTCDPADPDHGEETTCTAEGLEPMSAFTWTAEFADGSSESGDGTADADGVGELTFVAPESEEAAGDYTVTVRGTDADGEPYEERHEGTVGDGGPLSALPLPPADPTEEPTEDDTEAPPPGGGDDTAPAPDAEAEAQVDPVPRGAVAAGMGGAAPDPTPWRAAATVLVALAAGAHVAVRRARRATASRPGRAAPEATSRPW